ncbi:hypothetical protein [Streptomyces sp. NPDC056480]|uniref:hypothetical protein n=1 Tax=Streptomyces sp. NPDC056480 TaxID=3345833 RepID=UPI0036A6DA89
MYLVHAHMRSPAGAHIPEGIGIWVADAADSGDIEHVTVHASTLAHPVLGVFVLADRLEEAEEVVVAACRRMLATRPELRGWELAEGHVPLLAPLYDAVGGDGPALDETVQGRFRPRGSPSPAPEPGEI